MTRSKPPPPPPLPTALLLFSYKLLCCRVSIYVNQSSTRPDNKSIVNQVLAKYSLLTLIKIKFVNSTAILNILRKKCKNV